MTFALDHVVINTLFDMDRAAALMAQLGFTLTPRGYHSLGSINHLMMFEHDYLELIGLPSGTDKLRKDVLESPRGLNGLVFKVSDADATAARSARQRPCDARAAEFFEAGDHRRRRASRALSYGSRRAGTVRGRPRLLLPALYAGTGLASPVDVASQCCSRLERNGDRDLERRESTSRVMPRPLNRLPERQGDDWIDRIARRFRLTLISPARYRERYGELGVEADGRDSFFGAIVLDAPDLKRIGDLASADSGSAHRGRAGLAARAGAVPQHAA